MEHVSLPFAIGFVVWFLAGLFVAIKYGWFHLSEPFSEFPFSLKRFFASAFFVLCAFTLCMLIAALTHVLVVGAERSFVKHLFSFSSSGWYAVEQVGSLSAAVVGLRLFLSFIPSDYASLVVGERGGLKKWFKGVFFGLLFYPLILSVAWVVGVVVSWYFQEPRSPQTVLTVLAQLKESPLLFWIVSASIIFLVPYVEEVLFRGFLQSFLGGIFHPLLAVLVTASVFSIFHYSPLQKSSNFEIMFGLFVFSLLVSRLRVRENAIMASVGMHAAFNAMSLVLFF